MKQFLFVSYFIFAGLNAYSSSHCQSWLDSTLKKVALSPDASLYLSVDKVAGTVSAHYEDFLKIYHKAHKTGKLDDVMRAVQEAKKITQELGIEVHFKETTELLDMVISATPQHFPNEKMYQAKNWLKQQKFPDGSPSAEQIEKLFSIGGFPKEKNAELFGLMKALLDSRATSVLVVQNASNPRYRKFIEGVKKLGADEIELNFKNMVGQPNSALGSVTTTGDHVTFRINPESLVTRRMDEVGVHELLHLRLMSDRMKMGKNTIFGQTITVKPEFVGKAGINPLPVNGYDQFVSMEEVTTVKLTGSYLAVKVNNMLSRHFNARVDAFIGSSEIVDQVALKKYLKSKYEVISDERLKNSYSTHQQEVVREGDRIFGDIMNEKFDIENADNVHLKSFLSYQMEDVARTYIGNQYSMLATEKLEKIDQSIESFQNAGFRVGTAKIAGKEIVQVEFNIPGYSMDRTSRVSDALTYKVYLADAESKKRFWQLDELMQVKPNPSLTGALTGSKKLEPWEANVLVHLSYFKKMAHRQSSSLEALTDEFFKFYRGENSSVSVIKSTAPSFAELKRLIRETSEQRRAAKLHH